LNFACPICNARPKEKCKLTTGDFRIHSHIERRWIAKDHLLDGTRESAARRETAQTVTNSISNAELR